MNVRRPSVLSPGVLAPLGLAMAALWASPAPVRAADVVPLVELVEPPPGQPIFGTQRLRVEVRSPEAIESVRFSFDGRPVGTLREPPWMVEVDAGQENRPHRIEVEATDVRGRVGRSIVESPAIVVHDDLDLGLRQVYVTATRDGRRVLDLSREEIQLVDDGRPQEIVTFESGDLPFTAVVLVDGSESMRGAPMRAALAGVRAFVAGMRELDEARLLVVSDRLQRASPYLGRENAGSESLRRLEAGGSTTIHDTLFLALRSLESRQGRRVVVLLSDGHDTHSMLSMEQVRSVARETRSAVYWLRLARPAPDLVPRSAWRSPETARRDLKALDRTVEETGGRTLLVRGAEETGGALLEVLAELREQIAIGYYPEPEGQAGQWREIRVETDRRGVDLRYRARSLDR